LTVDLGSDVTVSYDLHRMALAGAWRGGFLDLKRTQHYQQRGEGYAKQDGKTILGLDEWEWELGRGFDDEKPLPRGPAPSDWMRFHGTYRHGKRVVFAYRVDDRQILELPELGQVSPTVLHHTLKIGAGDDGLRLCVGKLENPDAVEFAQWDGAFVRRGAAPATLGFLVSSFRKDKRVREFVAVSVAGDIEGLTWEIDREEARLLLIIPPAKKSRVIRIHRGAGTGEKDYAAVEDYLEQRKAVAVPDPAKWTGGGPLRFSEVLETTGTLGTGEGAYVVDTLTIPDSNPWNAWLRTSALAFFPDGRIAVTTLGGDVWIVSGVSASLASLRWRRYAAGLFEPLGVAVVDGLVYVTCRDRIVRLFDKNGDGEADYYESFFADPDVSPTFHAFNFDLVHDSSGNFYYSKCGQGTKFALQGAVVRVSSDGATHEFFATGFRTPNGMGILPDGRITVSDNQGNWMPASKISLIKRGGFYGSFRGKQTRDNFDQPILWMPQGFDSSCGGQLFVQDLRFGPLAGHLLHTSFGKGWIYHLSLQEVGERVQAAAVKMPFQFQAGIQRARVNPRDGQVYAVGLSGWQGPKGGKDGGLQRLRYTKREARMLLDTFVRKGRLELHFTCPLDRKTTADPARFKIEQWQYRWSKAYGSNHWKLSDPQKKGHDKVPVAKVELSGDGKVVYLGIDGLRPVQQMRLELDVITTDGRPLRETVFLTIHDIGK
jgi:hypothetical protein